MYYLYLLSQLLVFGDFIDDPVHEAWNGRQALRQFECERLSQAKAHEQHPGEVPATSARGTALFQIDALVCKRFITVNAEDRSARDALILQNLDTQVGELSALATHAIAKTSSNDASETSWVVDAFYPNPAMVRKIANASRMHLAERGLTVFDAPPLLTAGDVQIFNSLPMREAIPLACKRLFSTQSLDNNTVFLALALLHEKESQLHAGLCQNGKFRWLR